MAATLFAWPDSALQFTRLMLVSSILALKTIAKLHEVNSKKQADQSLKSPMAVTPASKGTTFTERTMATQNEAPHVTQVIVLDVGPHMKKFIDLSNRASAMAAKYESTGQVRYWTSTWAGPDTGRVIVTIEFPSLSSMAGSVSRMSASPEYAEWLADVENSGVKRLSTSVVTELRR
jgi:hypothetical protein